MFRPRIIPVLLLNKDHLVNQPDLRITIYIGDPINAVRIFNELVAMNWFSWIYRQHPIDTVVSIELVKDIGEESNMPFSVGGGINSLSQIQDIISAGAEKVIIGSYAVENPDFYKRGSQ
jgi:cyclase